MIIDYMKKKKKNDFHFKLNENNEFNEVVEVVETWSVEGS